uniref:Uncharacterized protein n=1 Tax=viral metagenome TaxID=1070528 RepID=A0A6M3LFI7_9ZZZZ
MATYYSSEKHDIGIVRTDTTEVGLMLLTEKDANGNDVPIYRTIYDSYLVSQYTTSPDFGATNPQKELHIVGESWRSGFGLEIADSAQPERYFSSIGCDLSNKDEAIAGWTPTVITVDTIAWTSPTSTTDTGAVWTNDDNIWDKNEATFAVVTVATVSWSGFLEANIASTNCDRVRVLAALTAAHANDLIDIDLYYGAAWHDLYSGAFTDNVWLEKGFTAQNITSVRFRFYNGDAGNSDGRIFEVYINNTAGTATGLTSHSADFNDKLYITKGDTLYKLNAGGTNFDTIYTFPATITDLAPMNIGGTDYLFIALGTSTDYQYMVAAETFTISTLTVKQFEFFEVVETTAPTLWGNDSANTIRATVNPLNGGTQWGAVTTIDSTYNNITGLKGALGTLYIAKEDKTYYLNSNVVGATALYLTKTQETELASTSGKNLWFDKGKLYIPCGTQALLESDISLSTVVNTWRNPADYCTNLSDFVGRIFAGAGDSRWNYVVVDNDTKVEILKGRLETIGSTTSWVWHPIGEITLTGCEAAFVSTVVKKRLYISSSVATESLYRIDLPSTYGDITSDANRSFKTDTYFITPYYHGGFKGINKSFSKMTATLGHTYDADVYFECWYQALGGSWVDMGDLKGSGTSMIATLFNTTPPVSTLFRFKFVAKTDSTLLTPILVNFDAKMMVRAEARNVIECTVRCADGILDKDGSPLQGVDAAIIRATIEEAQDATAPITFYDLFGATKYVNLMPIEPFSQVIKDQSGENIEQIFNLRLQEIELA